ncbi:MAG: ATP-binding protein, partial [Desulfovibrio sp.]|nr:ATP-binding protein [Desulfovibrio sp.]
ERFARAVPAVPCKHLAWSVEGIAPRSRLDASLLERALDEILENAVEASPEGGRVTAAISREDGDEGTPGRIRIAVKDQGPGVSAEIAPYLFDPFFTTKAVGVGMGLSLAKRLLEAMGGTIRLENRPGGGTAAIILLPGKDLPPAE